MYDKCKWKDVLHQLVRWFICPCVWRRTIFNDKVRNVTIQIQFTVYSLLPVLWESDDHIAQNASGLGFVHYDFFYSESAKTRALKQNWIAIIINLKWFLAKRYIALFMSVCFYLPFSLTDCYHGFLQGDPFKGICIWMSTVWISNLVMSQFWQVLTSLSEVMPFVHRFVVILLAFTLLFWCCITCWNFTPTQLLQVTKEIVKPVPVHDTYSWIISVASKLYFRCTVCSNFLIPTVCYVYNNFLSMIGMQCMRRAILQQ